MKFWQKSFIGILIIFILSINICLYLTSKYSFALNLERDTDRALGEYHFIINGINEKMNSMYYLKQNELEPASFYNLMRSYADYYKNQHVFLEVTQGNQLLFTNVPSGESSTVSTSKLKENSYTIEVTSIQNVKYLHIVGEIGGRYEDCTLSYIRDLSELYSAHSRLTRYLITISTLVETLLTLALLIILKRLTRPIRIMQKATKEIAGGVYDRRIYIPSRDEFHDLAENFNQMAFSIQEKIEELDKNSQDKQRLIDNLAHELRTPLTAIHGYAEYLQNANANEENRMKAVGYIISESDRMKNLAFKLLDLALVRNTKLDLQVLSISTLFHQIREILESKLKEKNIQLVIRSSLDTLIGDGILLESLIVNLINNAEKASSNDSIIKLSAYFDSAPILEVQDFGQGMDEDQILLVCEPFYRVDKARSRSSGGIGLGLSLCREIAQLHGAELKINSSPGKGTTIQMVFTTSLQLNENSEIAKDV